MPWIHVDDLVRLFLYCATEGALSGAVNGTAPNPVTNAEFTEALAGVLHRPAVMPVPKFGLKLLMGEMAEAVLESQRAVPAVVSSAGFEFQFSEVRAALADVLR